MEPNKRRLSRRIKRSISITLLCAILALVAIRVGQVLIQQIPVDSAGYLAWYATGYGDHEGKLCLEVTFMPLKDLGNLTQVYLYQGNIAYDGQQPLCEYAPNIRVKPPEYLYLFNYPLVNMTKSESFSLVMQFTINADGRCQNITTLYSGKVP